MENSKTGLRFVIADGKLELEVSFDRESQQFQFTLKDLEDDPRGTTVTAELTDARGLMGFIGTREIKAPGEWEAQV